jgi:hypothetical protein
VHHAQLAFAMLNRGRLATASGDLEFISFLFHQAPAGDAGMEDYLCNHQGAR